METHPLQRGSFHRFMEAQFACPPTWLDVQCEALKKKFRLIMHDDDDETCIRILQSQIPALGPDSVI
ncbi:Uncharacterized protein TPAR_05041 [Tolypocladium paradoxum]|uniref:Uncharacterized protein n=1 Tax=Tolypocladium paradoxum TaxID=94208 RepID=A0A2S4KX77_9HYPO|nr:Uncharacterized protein TPAR_05041 [Tolypocladium paradoxum]